MVCITYKSISLFIVFLKHERNFINIFPVYKGRPLRSRFYIAIIAM